MWPVALVQLIPFIGQVILLGYGMEVARSVYVGQTGLPTLKWLRAFADGLRFLIAGLLFLTPILGVVPTIATIGLNNAQLNPLGLLLSVGLTLFVLVIIVGLHLSGVRYAIENKGLFAPNSIVKLLLKNRAPTAMLLLNAIGMGPLAVLATSLGLLLLVVPGLFVLVACSVAWWYLLATFAIELGISKADPTWENKTQLD